MRAVMVSLAILASTGAVATAESVPECMVHAKILLFDDSLAITGSPNLDMRSMYLNFEIALFHYSAEEIETVAGWIRGMMDKSVPYQERPRNIVREWSEGLCALISPLL